VALGGFRAAVVLTLHAAATRSSGDVSAGLAVGGLLAVFTHVMAPLLMAAALTTGSAVLSHRSAEDR
jgi:hypothetical protein